MKKVRGSSLLFPENFIESQEKGEFSRFLCECDIRSFMYYCLPLPFPPLILSPPSFFNSHLCGCSGALLTCTARPSCGTDTVC